ncbi:trafficking protein particle complex subunit 14 isoform X2 [Xenopus laevis]|uniref:Trafficking protein particle complex subunit 14 isoform X2 n=1 Tax=Xenopus laevis TaxID=8355 RepID=A0A8J0ULL2_XENLA|nr:trafficking protein particle complex subunit 14 isoform X2 [Xenopus laevis]
MESQCDYSMIFPACPLLPSDLPVRYRALPRRNHLYLGETLRFLLVLRLRSPGEKPQERAGTEASASGEASQESPGPEAFSWAPLAASLSALASVCPGEEEAEAEEEESGDCPAGYRGCKAILSQQQPPPGPAPSGTPVTDPVVSSDEVIFPLSVSLDRLPPGTVKAKIVVTVWKRDTEHSRVKTFGYRSLLQNSTPGQIFREEQGTFKAQVSTLLTVLPPPTLRCRQINVAGKHFTAVKVNTSSQDELSICDVRILPNFNANYLPVMPDGSVLLVDNVCHQSGDISMASFLRLHSTSSQLPSSLYSMEEHNFLFQLQAGEHPPEDAKEGLEVPLVAVVHWSTPKPLTSDIYTHYKLPSIRLERPRFVMTACCESPVQMHKPFRVTYTLLNDLQDFLAVRLVWTPDANTAGRSISEEDRRLTKAVQEAVVCHTPINSLGFCRKGSSVTVGVTFMALKSGLFELSQHMKLKLQFTASASQLPPDARPVSRRSSPSSPALRDLERQQSGVLGRSQSFSHQQPTRGQLIRTGSVMERRAITPPVGSPLGRPLYLPPERATLSLDKIAKRQCKVLVVQ